MAARSPLFVATHDSKGLSLVEGYPNFGKEKCRFNSNGKVKCFALSPLGDKIVLIANGCVQVLYGAGWPVQHTVEHPTAQELAFSPGGSYLAVWCLYIKSKDDSSRTPNLHVYDLREGCKLLASFFQTSQVDWQPQWTGDESVFARNVTSEVHFYKADNLTTIDRKRVEKKLTHFSLAPTKATKLVAFRVMGNKGAPQRVSIFKYPQFKERIKEDDTDKDKGQPLISHCFFKADTVEFLWNKKSTGLLLLASADQGDASSYYGERMVFLLRTKPAESMKIAFDKSGPVHSVTWTPEGENFLAVYGSNPAKCSLFNMEGNTVKAYGEEPRNLAVANPVNNLVLAAAFGNMSPRIEVWDKAKAKSVGCQECPEMTYIEWSPCGQYLLTATCSPRLRVNNGYRIYHYSGSLQFEHICPAGTELYSAKWLPCREAARQFTISSVKVEGIQSAIKVASAQRYIPPGQRKAMSAGDQMVQTTKQFLSQIDKYDPNSAAAVANQPPPPLSGKALRNKRRKDAKRAEKEAEFKAKNTLVIEEPEGFVKKGKPKPKEEVTTVQLSGDGEKKAKAIKKKLQRIEKLKKEKAEGKELEKQQLSMIEKETELIAELRTLTV